MRFGSTAKVLAKVQAQVLVNLRVPEGHPVPESKATCESFQEAFSQVVIICSRPL